MVKYCRCGSPKDEQSRFEEWIAVYGSRQAGYATYRYLDTMGADAVHPEIRTILEIHDKITQCDDPLGLA